MKIVIWLEESFQNRGEKGTLGGVPVAGECVFGSRSVAKMYRKNMKTSKRLEASFPKWVQKVTKSSGPS